MALCTVKYSEAGTGGGRQFPLFQPGQILSSPFTTGTPNFFHLPASLKTKFFNPVWKAFAFAQSWLTMKTCQNEMRWFFKILMLVLKGCAIFESNVSVRRSLLPRPLFRESNKINKSLLKIKKKNWKSSKLSVKKINQIYNYKLLPNTEQICDQTMLAMMSTFQVFIVYIVDK